MIGSKSRPNLAKKKGVQRPASKVVRISLLMVIAGAILFSLLTIFSTLALSTIFQRELIRISEESIGDMAEILTHEIFTELPPVYANEEFGHSWKRKEWREEMDGIIRGHLGTLSIIKLKIYNRQRQIIYSTDPEIIGALDRYNPELQRTLGGEVVSRLEKGQSVWDLVGEKGLRQEMIETYVPMLDRGGKDPFRIIGVFEIYRDVDFLVGALKRMRKTFALLVGGSLFLLFATFTMVVIRNLERDRMSEKARTVNELTVGINHQLNNSLAGILTSLDLLLSHSDDYQVNEETSSVLQRCKEEVRRIQYVISKFSSIRKPIVSTYIDGINMIDLEKSR